MRVNLTQRMVAAATVILSVSGAGRPAYGGGPDPATTEWLVQARWGDLR